MDNQFKLDLDAEKTNFESAIRLPSQASDTPRVQFEPVVFGEAPKLRPDISTTQFSQIEMIRPISGEIKPSMPETFPLIPVASSGSQQSPAGSQEALYKQMNTMSLAMQELNSKIDKKQNLTSNSDTVTEARITNDQKNLMFFDRVNRSQGYFTWS